MMYSPVVNAFGCLINPQLLMIAVAKSNVHWSMHTAQNFALELNTLQTPAVIIEKTDTKTEVNVPTKVIDMLGIPVMLDDSMPLNTIELRDPDGHTLARIDNLAIPTHFDY